MKTIVKNVRIVTMNAERQIINNGYVVIEGTRIKETGLMADGCPDDGTIIDGEQGILMPGMINVHTHIGMIPFRGLGDDCKDRLRRFLLPLEQRCMTRELARASARYAMCELLLGGVTTFFDMYYYEDDIAQAADQMGIRAVLGETVIEQDLSTESGESYHFPGFAYAKTFIENWKDHPRITPCAAPHGTSTCSAETLLKCYRLSEQYNLPFTLHAAEMDYEIKYFKDRYQKTPIAWLADLGVLDQHMVAAHCIMVTEDDLQLMKQHQISVAHCIGSNAKAAKGVAPVTRMLEMGIPVGLGTDGPASGNTLDILTQFKLAADFHKNATSDRSAFPAEDIVSMGTIQGARALNMEHMIGSIEAGKQADLTLIETKSVNMFPVYDPCSALVYSANAGNVDTVFVAGKCLVRNKKIIAADLEEVKQDLIDEMMRSRFTEEAEKLLEMI
ncbi:MAG: amidohydrolase [Lachnospiraceae bacterium]